MKHLWEYAHPYYCSESNYYSNEPGNSFDSWADFYADMGSMDRDLNLVFRWDWKVDEDDGSHRLQLFYMFQRKGIFACFEVEVTPDDEPAVRAFLEPYWALLGQMWAPISEGPS